MMKRIYIILLLFPFITQAQILNISNDNSKSTNPRIVINKSVSYVFWSDNNNGNYSLQFKVHNNGAWSNVKKIESSQTIHLSSLCKEDSTILDVLWIDGIGKNNRLIYGRVVDSVLVDSVEIFRNDTSEIVFSSCLYDQPTKTLHITWDVSSGDSIYTYYSMKTKNGIWSNRQMIITNRIWTGNPCTQILKDKNQDILCLWFSTDSMSVNMIRKSTQEWIEGTKLSFRSEGIGRDFVACNDDSLNVHFVSLPASVLTCPCNVLLYTKWDGNQWNYPEVVPRNENYAYYTEHYSPSICFSKNHYPVISWEQHSWDMYLTLYAKFIGTSVITDLGWHVNTPITIHPNIENPSTAIDNQDNINYVWQDSSDGDYDIYFYKTSLLTSVKLDDNAVILTKISLYPNYPNPFNPYTNISFHIPTKSFVSLKVFDIVGREIETIIAEEMQPGNYTRQWNTLNLPSGVYFYRLQAGASSETKKLILLR